MVEGRTILTLEGVSDNERKLYADAFQAAAGLQCGFCTPGLVLRIKWLTDQETKLSRAEIARALDGHLCRCTGYVKIIDAVELIQAAKAGGAPPAVVEDGGVGQKLKRYQGGELALGARPFVADIEVPGLLHGAVTLSPHARARVIRIDTSKAARSSPASSRWRPPGTHWATGGLVRSIRTGRASWLRAKMVRCVGDVLAAVAAETPRLAREAAKLIEVEYELDPSSTPPKRSRASARTRSTLMHENVPVGDAHYARGDAQSALAAFNPCGHRHFWATQRIEHLFLELRSRPGACTGCPTLPPADLYSQSQGIFEDRQQLASVLGEPEERLFVELVPNGGGFGGKEDMWTIQAQTALLACMTGRSQMDCAQPRGIDPHASQTAIRN